MKKPIIALTPTYREDFWVGNSTKYLNAVEQSGGLPIIMNLTSDPEVIAQYAELADGFIFTGGDDIDPCYFGETVHEGFGDFIRIRDIFELPLANQVIKTKKPMLGICRGIQLINVAYGGDLYQDIPIEFSKKTPHRQNPPYSVPTHPVEIVENTMLYDIIGKKDYATNSMHHQSVKRVAKDWVASAYASDGTIEAIELPNYPFALGLQWHPEHMFETDDAAKKIFKTFIDACKK